MTNKEMTMHKQVKKQTKDKTIAKRSQPTQVTKKLPKHIRSVTETNNIKKNDKLKHTKC